MFVKRVQPPFVKIFLDRVTRSFIEQEHCKPIDLYNCQLNQDHYSPPPAQIKIKCLKNLTSKFEILIFKRLIRFRTLEKGVFLVLFQTCTNGSDKKLNLKTHLFHPYLRNQSLADNLSRSRPQTCLSNIILC